MKYKNNNNIVDAFEFNNNTRMEIFNWIPYNMRECDIDENFNPVLLIYNKATEVALVGDYIIKDNDGEFHPCAPDIFKETYEKVEE